MVDNEFIEDLARKYANTCIFKSDFPHDFKSDFFGFIEGFKIADRLTEINENNIETILMDFMLWYKVSIPIGTQKTSMQIVGEYLSKPSKSSKSEA